MITNRKKALLLAASALSVTGTLALAQDAGTQAELDALRARVEALETANTGSGGGDGDLRIGNTTLDLYGYVKADFFYDTDFELGDLADTSRIGEPQFATDGTFGATVRQSRVGLRTTTPSALGDIGGQLELDLFSGGTDGPAELRLRHANITIGDHWLIGQYWTNFQPLDTYPTSVEFNGPVGIPFARVPQVRFTNKIGGNATFALSVEENVGASNSDDPVLTASAEYNDGKYIARASALYGRAQSGDVEVDQTGFTLSAGIRPWEGGLFQVNYVDGEALGPYLIGFGDAIVSGEANDVDGFTVEFRQQISEKWNVGIAYGEEDYDLPTSTGTLAFTELETIHVNAFYKATDDLTFSAEYFFGERNDASTGRTFDSDRVQFAAQLNF
ncbi:MULTISPECIES: DcaP family trimeric outer membrane transporter [Ruegeria]|uniref:DcaP family trimeric outer membrane transporter n=1 Tax=Ruegeria TaxID=97050 RepID=UPI00147AEB60|nr:MULTISPECIES: DcaP family trimeric outer membrane transporter [Ruegeria]